MSSTHRVTAPPSTRKGWHTQDEIGFIEGFARRYPMAARRYCDLVVDGWRNFDETVDEGEVRLFADRVRLRLQVQ